MAVSVRMDPILEKELEAAAKRLGVTKSHFIIDAVQRALGHKDSYKLFLEAQAKYPDGGTPARSDRRPADPQDWNAYLEAKLRVKHRRESAEYLAWQRAKRAGKRKAA